MFSRAQLQNAKLRACSWRRNSQVSTIDFTGALHSAKHLSGVALAGSRPIYLLYILKCKYLILQIVAVPTN